MQLYGDTSDECYSWRSLGATGSAASVKVLIYPGHSYLKLGLATGLEVFLERRFVLSPEGFISSKIAGGRV